MSEARLVVYSDLDGTLLAAETYDWTPAEPAVRALRDRAIPLVLTSSKTRAEIEHWRERLGLQDPFICENGGALYVPVGTFERPPRGAPFGPYWRVAYGTPHPILRECLMRIGRSLGVRLRGFTEMDDETLRRRTGLEGGDLDRSRQREFDEPFAADRPLSGEEEGRLIAEASSFGLRVTRGGTFYHLMGQSSKARAAREMTEHYARAWGPVRTVGVGDAPNDLELLATVDDPVVVARPDGSHAPELRRGVPRARFTAGAGPVGFCEGILEILGVARKGNRPAPA